MTDIEIKNLKDYCNWLEKAKTKITENSNNDVFETMTGAKDVFSQALNNVQGELDKWKNMDSVIKNWPSYNDQYKTLFNNRIKNNKNLITQVCNFWIEKGSNNAQLYLNTLINLNDVLSFDVLQIFDSLKEGNSNYILFGKNGAGKTSLLKKLQSDFSSNTSIVAPADRQLGYQSNIYHNSNEVNLKSALAERAADRTLPLLSLCIREQELKERREDLTGDEIITNKAKQIFDSLGLDRKLEISEKGDLLLYADDINQYLLTNASDGEKTVLYFIMIVLLSPENSIMFIDEPENHLNGSLMKKLFDTLEQKRGDIKFVYATHNISFITSRKGTKLIYLEKTNKQNCWKLKHLDDYKNIPLELILDIEGTNDDVIFCEGEGDSSLDIRLYSLLFPNKQIISAEGCEKVTLQTKIFNENEKILRRKAFGIVDYDYREESDVDHLNSLNVYSLCVNEIENAYILDFCIDAVRQYMCSDKSLENIKSIIIEYIRKNMESIEKDYATKTFRKLHLTNKFTSVNCIDQELERINEENKNRFKEKYNWFVNELNNSIACNDYNALMKLIPGKMVIKNVTSAIGIDLNNYVNVLLEKLKDNPDLRDKLKRQLFGDQSKIMTI